MYNFGVRLYNHDEFEHAVVLLTRSCSCLLDWCGANKERLYEASAFAGLCTRWCLIAKCHDKNNDSKAAVAALRKGLMQIAPLIDLPSGIEPSTNMVNDFVTMWAKQMVTNSTQLSGKTPPATTCAGEDLVNIMTELIEQRSITTAAAGMMLERGLIALAAHKNAEVCASQGLLIDMLLQSIYVASTVTDILGRVRVLLSKAQLVYSRGTSASSPDTAAGVLTYFQDAIIMLQDGLKGAVDKSVDFCNLTEQLGRVYVFYASHMLELSFQNVNKSIVGDTTQDMLQKAFTVYSSLIHTYRAHDDMMAQCLEGRHLWYELRLLTDLCETLGEYSLQLHSLGLRCLYASLCGDRGENPPTSHVIVEKCNSLTELCVLHHRMQFSQLGIVFSSQAADTMAHWTDSHRALDQDLDAEAVKRSDLQIKLAHALNLYEKTDHEASMDILQKALSVCVAGKGRQWTSLTAKCNSYMTNIHVARGDTYDAMQTSFESLQLRVQLLPACAAFLRRAAVSGDTAARPEDSSVDATAPETATKRNMQLSTFSSGSAGSFSHWQEFGGLLESLVQTGQLAIAYGRGKEGDMYLQAAFNIASNIGSSSWMSRSLFAQAQASFHRRDYQKCQHHVDLLLEHCEDRPCPLAMCHAVQAHVLRGDYFRKTEDISESLQMYSLAAEVLKTLRGATFLQDALYQLNIDGQQYDITTVLDVSSVQCADPPAKAVKNKSSATKVQPNVLNRLQVYIDVKRGRALSLQGEHEHAQSTIVSALDAFDGPQTFQRALGLYYLGCSRQHQLLPNGADAWTLHAQRGEPLSDSTNTKGAGKTAKRKPKSKAKAGNMAVDALTVRQTFEDCIQIAVSLNLTSLVTKSCHRLARMLGNQIQSLRLLHQALCHPQCRHMQSVLCSNSAHTDGATAELTKLFALDGLRDDAAFTQEYVQRLPKSWTVCTVTLDSGSQEEDSALMVTRIQSNEPTIAVRIPLPNSDGDHSWTNVTAAWARLMRENIESLAVDPPQGQGNTHTAEQKSTWWSRRSSVDDEIGSILSSVEENWFGGLKGLLLGQVKNATLAGELRNRADDIVSATELFGGHRLDTATARVIMGCIDTLSEDELIRVCRDMVAGHIDSSMKFLPGTKTSVDEVACDLASNFRSSYDAACKDVDMASALERLPTILLLGADVQQIPWESMPCLIKHPVSRMPSLPFVMARLEEVVGPETAWHQTNPGVHSDSGFYVLNPERDLAGTQETLEPEFVGRTAWEGVVAERPTADDFRNGLSGKDVFVYCGHSTGERYFRGHEMPKMERCAVTLLMGCSSGKLTHVGDFGVEGMPLWYTLAGCPALVANLWDVTDRDIDKFCASLLESWLPGKLPAPSNGGGKKKPAKKRGGKVGARASDCSDNDEELTSLPPLAQARGACKLKFLNGAAPVCYGVPVRMLTE
jgi:hypothetical protein